MPRRTNPNGARFIAMSLLSLESLPAFLTKSAVVVIYVHPRAVGLGNQTLLRKLQAQYGNRISFGSIARDAFLGMSPLYRAFVGAALKDLGLPGQVLPGYYVLVHGTLLGWHPGAFDDDVARIVAGVSVGIGLAQFFAGRSFSQAALSSWQLYEAGPANAAYEFFKNLIDDAFSRRADQERQQRQRQQHDQDQERRRARQEQVFLSAVAKAYAVLGLDENVSDQELKRRHRLLSREYHPDLVTCPNEKARREEEMKKINNAYDVVAAARGL